jgi:class 3 adenylate cyclase
MISACSDAELLQRMAGGDRRAFDELYERHAAWLHLRLARRCGDAATVEEALQDTFLAVWRRPERFAADGEVAAWLWGIGIRRPWWERWVWPLPLGRWRPAAGCRWAPHPAPRSSGSRSARPCRSCC